MTSLSIFAFDSHAVRTVTDDATGEALFVGKDVCAVLEYKDHTNAIKQHCRGVAKHHPILDAENLSDVQKSPSVHSIKGGKSQGTWAAELVAIRYAAWIEPSFEVRVYRAFRNSVAADKDWRKMRHAAASTTKVANDILKFIRESNGKDTEPKHYMNEALMVNWALSGKFEKIDRDGLSQDELDLMAYLQERNAVLIGRGIGYDERKPMIKQYAMDWRLDRSMGLLK